MALIESQLSSVSSRGLWRPSAPPSSLLHALRLLALLLPRILRHDLHFRRPRRQLMQGPWSDTVSFVDIHWLATEGLTRSLNGPLGVCLHRGPTQFTLATVGCGMSQSHMAIVVRSLTIQRHISTIKVLSVNNDKNTNTKAIWDQFVVNWYEQIICKLWKCDGTRTLSVTWIATISSV